MSQQSENQNDSDPLAKNYEANVRGEKKAGPPGFKAPDARYPETAAKSNPQVAQPEARWSMTSDSPQAKAAAPTYENGVIDAPAGSAPAIQKPKPVNEDAYSK
jgi:hypothetical protein